MISLARFSIRRPRAALAGWLAVIAALTVLGLNVDHWVSPTVSASGTQAERAKQLTEQKFGTSQPMPILLEGPRAQLDQQGPRLVAALLRQPDTSVVSAWNGGTASAQLRPRPTAGVIIASVARAQKNVIRTDLPKVQSVISHEIQPPVKAYLSGEPVLNQAVRDESVSLLRTYAAIATGVLFVLLLIGLRAPIGALMVTVVASATTMATFGLMTLLGRAGFEIDAICLGTAAIAGLARGASYSLVMLDRFHREKEAHPDRPAEAHLDAAVGTTGRAILYGGTAMLVALIVVDLFGVTNVVETIGVAALLATALATGAAVVVVPAGLALAGNAAAWHLPAPAVFSRAWDRLVAAGGSVVRHPLPFGALVTAALLALAVPALGAKWGAQNLTKGLLPADNQARIAMQEISRVMGPGYLSPYQLIVYDRRGPITGAATLSRLNRFESRIARDPAVKSVLGPGGSFNANANQLGRVGPGLQNSIKVSKESQKGLAQLIDGLGQAGAGSAQLQGALAQAASGAGQLHAGSGEAASGAGLLRSYLAQAHSGSQQVQAGLNQAYAGAIALKSGAAQALAGANQLSAGLGAGAPQVKAGLPLVGQLATASASASSQLKQAQGQVQSARSGTSTALDALNGMGVGKSDPRYQEALAALTQANSGIAAADATLAGAVQNAATAAFIAGGVNAQITKLAPQLTAAASGAAQLADGIKKLRSGNAQLAGGLGQLVSGNGQISGGLGQLTAAAGTLQGGLDQLTGYIAQLASGLSAGVPQVAQLTAGLATMQAAVRKSRGQIPSTKDLETLFKSSPGLFSSGYFVLAAVAGAPAADRNAANLVVNLTRGGNAGQIVVYSRYPLDDPRVKALGTRLKALSASFARSSGLQTLVGGVAADQWDTAQATMDKLPAVIIADVVVVAVLLMLLLRSILIPSVAILTAALTTFAGFGVIELLFGGGNPPLGGTGSLNPVVITEILSALYGATLIYIVVLMSRARDFYVRTGDARASLVRGMGATVASTTGMATITIGVLIPFAFAGLLPIRMISVAAVLAVAMIAYVVLPVLLPAAMSLLGRIGWWPTHGPAVGATAPPVGRQLRLPRLHRPHRRPRPAH